MPHRINISFSLMSVPVWELRTALFSLHRAGISACLALPFSRAPASAHAYASTSIAHCLARLLLAAAHAAHCLYAFGLAERRRCCALAAALAHRACKHCCERQMLRLERGMRNVNWRDG